MRREAKRIHANGLTHFVSDTGPIDEPPAILLHGFPESHAAWDRVAPRLVEAGYRVIAPDLRGFGDTDVAATTADYDLYTGAVEDVLAICDALNVQRAHLVGHDFGAPVAWILAAQYPDRFISLTALSAGHVRAFLKADGDQLRKSWYILFHQLRWFCEAAYRFNNWALLRWHWANREGIDEIIDAMSRPGRLTAGLNWYRANISLARMLKPPAPGTFGEEIVRLPTMGVWSDQDRYLGERQMRLSERFVDAPWRFERLAGVSHWIPTETPDRLAALLIDHWSRHG